MDRDDLYTAIEQRVTEYIGFEKRDQMTQEIVSDIMSFLITGSVYISEQPTMSFGQFEGVALKHIPDEYLKWAYNQQFMIEKHATLHYQVYQELELRRLKKLNETKTQRP